MPKVTIDLCRTGVTVCDSLDTRLASSANLDKLLPVSGEILQGLHIADLGK